MLKRFERVLTRFLDKLVEVKESSSGSLRIDPVDILIIILIVVLAFVSFSFKSI